MLVTAPSPLRSAVRVTVCALAILAFSAASTQASTIVTGGDDRTSPLVIEPSGTGTVHDARDMVFFVQKMPVTKTVNRITLGDIGLDPGCTYTGPVLKLFIRQHPTGQIGTETSSLYWEGNALEEITADTALEPRTWRTEPITFVKGRGYSFWVQGTKNGCESYKVRSWPHNQSQVNAGDERCDRVVGNSFRMWHESGQDDAVPCPYDLVPENFDQGMPEGWLSVNQSWGSSYVETTQFYEQGAEPPQPACPYPLGQYGGIAQRWRNAVWNSDWGEYVCLWDQRYPDWLSPSSPFYPNDPDDGWYYGLGWTNPTADWPRDMYVKLELDEEELAAWYKPNLYFDTDEKWRPLDLDQFFAERDSSGVLLNRNCFKLIGPPPPLPEVCGEVSSPDDLMEHDETDAHLKINGPDANDDSEYRSPDPSCNVDDLYDCNGGSTTTLYGYVSQPLADSEYRYVGYWGFYRFNHFSELSGDHEGDWEGAAIAPSYDRPGSFDFASFSSHGPWYSYLRSTLRCADSPYYPFDCGTEEQKGFSHVKTYVAEGSHANYPLPCDSNVIGHCPRANNQIPGEHDYDGAKSWGHNYSAAGLHSSGIASMPPADGTHWVDWLGSWGWSGSPASPGRQSQFFEPWSACGWGENCLSPVARAAAERRSSGHRRTPGANPPTRCRQWFGPQVTAIACNRGALRRGLGAGRLGTQGKVKLRVRRETSTASRRALVANGSAAGLAQTVGPPLSPGDSLVLRKPPRSRLLLLVRIQLADRIYERRFRPRPFAGRRLVMRAFRLHGRPAIVIVGKDKRRTIASAFRRIDN